MGRSLGENCRNETIEMRLVVTDNASKKKSFKKFGIIIQGIKPLAVANIFALPPSSLALMLLSNSVP